MEAQARLDLDLGRFDGLALRVKGDGQAFKVNLKTADQENTPEETYQGSFDTQPGVRCMHPHPAHTAPPAHCILMHADRPYQISKCA